MAKRAAPAAVPAAPRGRIVQASVSCATPDSFRAAKVRGLFDLQPAAQARRDWSVELPAENEAWQIGLIVGPSGSGKSTLAREAFGGLYTPPPWPVGQAVVDGFGAAHEVGAIVDMLTAVGFASPPAWLRPYEVLSNGERFRCDLARALLGDDVGGTAGSSSSESIARTIVYDEYTSLVDRTVAQIGSAALAKAVRRTPGLRFVAVTCHYDVADWLECDWVLDMAGPALARGRLRRPPIALEIDQEPADTWRWFAHHHYLTHSVQRGAAHYVARIADQPVATCVVGTNFGRCRVDPGYRGMRKIARLVTLPDYQGVGIAGALLDHVAARLAADRLQARIVTSHPGLVRRLVASPRWRVERQVLGCDQQPRWNHRGDRIRDSGARYITSAAYIGQPLS